MTSRIPAPIVTPDLHAVSDLAQRVLAVLEAGWHRRESITSVVWSSDRAVRDAVLELRRAGVPVISSSGTAGYRLANDPEELDRLIEEMTARVEDTSVTIAALRRTQVRMRAEHEAQEPLQLSLGVK